MVMQLNSTSTTPSALAGAPAGIKEGVGRLSWDSDNGWEGWMYGGREELHVLPSTLICVNMVSSVEQ